MYFQLFILIVATNATKLQLSESLNAVLDYGIINKIRDQNFLLGVAISRAQLSVIEKDVSDEEDLAVLHTLQQKCSFLLLLDDSGNKLLSPRVWEIRSKLRQLSAAPPPITRPTIPLGPGMSDMCLQSLFPECSISLQCLWAELCDNTEAYQITHQILYWTVFRQICTKHSYNKTFAHAVIEHKCSQIMEEHQMIRAWGVPSTYVDIYWEQMVVCGLHGFLPFFHDKDFLLSLQSPRGCFALQSGGDCQMHFSGVAAAAVSIFLKLKFGKKDN